MRIDLHTHSWVSDGTESPAEVVAQARRADVDVIALTDHDQTGGWAEAASAARRLGVGLVPGMEVTCQAPGSRISVHMLSYLQDPSHEELTHTVHEARQSRQQRALRMVERLAEDFPIEWDDVTALTQDGATIGRPHIADALVRAKVVESREEAFADMLHPRAPYYVGHPAIDPVDAVRMIRDAGGVPVMAHPMASKRGRVVSDAELLAIVDAGLAGVEIRHRDNSAPGRAKLKSLARERGLIVTGSSDYHGSGKPNLLGENTTKPKALARIIEQGNADLVVSVDVDELLRA